MSGPFTVVWRYRVTLHVLRHVIAAQNAGRNPVPFGRECAGVDAVLADRPEAAGESRDEFLRILPGRFVTVYYEIYPEPRVVLVTGAVCRLLPDPPDA